LTSILVQETFGAAVESGSTRGDMRRITVLLGLALWSLPSLGSPQTPRGIPARQPAAGGLLDQGDLAHTALRPGEALEDYLRILSSEPTRYDALWRAAREAVNLGMLATEGEERKSRYAEAEDFARRARAANASGVEGAEWLAIALGRQALDGGPRARVKLAVEVREAALAALALDSANAGAHHVLGVWHAEVRRLSGLERWLARRLLGGAIFEDASWEAAERHLLESVALDPGGLIHHLDLARLYLDMGRTEEARLQLKETLERPAIEPVDPLHKQEAQELLRTLGRGGDSGLPGPELSRSTSGGPP
jgi:tetratricopeptide (TPR) repeat protein